MIYLYTDGSVSRPREGNSPGGWAFTFHHDGTQHKGSGGCKSVTSNQMEMVAVIKGLQHLLALRLTNEQIIVVSDSQYVIYGCSRWLMDWKRNGWLNGKGKKLKNKEFWKQLDYLSNLFKIRYKWIRGHKGHPDNEACDVMAREAAFRAAGITAAGSMTC